MRTLVKMTARSDFAYDNTYNHRLQARLYRDLDRAGYDEIHDDRGPKLFSYSNPFPPRNGIEGDDRRLLFASTDPEMVTGVAYGLCSDSELNIGEMPFEVCEAFTLDPAVQERGELVTGTPIVLRFGTETARKFGIDTEHERTYWRPEHGMDLFFDRLYGNLQHKYQLAYDEPPPEPPYFTEYSLDRSVSKPVAYADGNVTYIGSEWTFAYEVESANHRRILNLALDTGLGELNGLGFGFVNRAEDA